MSYNLFKTLLITTLLLGNVCEAWSFNLLKDLIEPLKDQFVESGFLAL